MPLKNPSELDIIHVYINFDQWVEMLSEGPNPHDYCFAITYLKEKCFFWLWEWIDIQGAQWLSEVTKRFLISLDLTQSAAWTNTGQKLVYWF